MRVSVFARIAVVTTLVFSLIGIAPPPAAEATGATWQWLNPLPRGETLRAVDMVDANTGYAVGGNGTIMKTYDGGKGWIAKSSGTTKNLYAVSFLDASTGWVGGDAGVILKTSGSSGATWTQQNTGVTDGQITALHFRSALKGWASDAAGRILRTTDGGTTWLKTDVASTSFTSLYFVSDLVGFAVTQEGTVWKSTDGGVTWPLVAAQMIPGAPPLTDITFKPGDDQIGWITAQAPSGSSAFRTSDGGATWLPVTVGDPGGLGWHSVSFAPASSTVWMVGYNSQPYEIAKVTDGAVPTYVQYAYAEYGSDQPLWSVDSVSADRAVGVGNLGMITRTSNGGTTWADRDQVIAREFLRAVQFLDRRTGYIAADDGEVYKSTNAGKTWAPTGTGNAYALRDLHFLNRTTGWVVGTGGRIYKTVDGGTNWTQQTSGTTAELLAVHFADALNGWATTSNGVVLHTVDGGTTWLPQATGQTSALYDIDFYSATEGAFVGAGGKVFVTANGGTTWTPAAAHGGGGDWTAVEYVAPGTFYVTGQNMIGTLTNFSLLRFTNAGANYTPLPNDITPKAAFTGNGQAYDIQFLDANRGWVAFANGKVGRTIDGGATWTYESAMDDTIRSLSVVDNDAAWICGPNARIMSTYTFYPKKVYRFYRPSTGTHFYTSDVNEKYYILNNLSHIYTFEGVSYEYDDYYATQSLYRFFRPSTGTHFYTASETEKANVKANMAHIYTYEGPVYSISGTPLAGGSTVYRFFKPSSGTHFYTADPVERDNVKNTMSHIYTYEGAAYYLPQ